MIVHSRVTKVFNLLQLKLYGCSQSAKCQSFCSLALLIFNTYVRGGVKDIALTKPVQKRAGFCNNQFNSIDITSIYLWDPPSGDCLAQLKWPSMMTRFAILLSVMFLHDLLCTSKTFK